LALDKTLPFLLVFLLFKYNLNLNNLNLLKII